MFSRYEVVVVLNCAVKRVVLNWADLMFFEQQGNIDVNRWKAL